MKIVFFGTSENSVILLETVAPHFQVVGIVTMPDAPIGRKQTLTPSLVAQFAANSEVLKDVPVFKPLNPKEDEFLNDLKALEADMFLVLSYGKILPQEVIDIPPLKTVNVHPSLLPLYRGATPIQSTLLNGETVTGNSIIVMDPEMDHGPLLAQHEVGIDPHETYPELEAKLARDSAQMILDVIPQYAEQRLEPREQEHEKATFTKYISKADGKVNWEEPAEKIYNRYRAFYRWPGIWTTWNGETLKIIECRPDKEGTALTGGAVSALPAGTVTENGAVVCGNGTTLELLKVQRAGKNTVTIQEFLNGNKNFIGSRLGN